MLVQFWLGAMAPPSPVVVLLAEPTASTARALGSGAANKQQQPAAQAKLRPWPLRAAEKAISAHAAAASAAAAAGEGKAADEDSAQGRGMGAAV